MPDTNIPTGAIITAYGAKYTVNRSNDSPDSPHYIGVDTRYGPGLVGLGAIRNVELPEGVNDSTFEAVEDFNHDLLQLAIEYERPITFTYEKPNGEVSQRTAVPLGTTETYAGKTIVYTENEDDEVKGFRLDRIKGAISV